MMPTADACRQALQAGVTVFCLDLDSMGVRRWCENTIRALAEGVQGASEWTRPPVPELAASQFQVVGGTIYPGSFNAPRGLIQGQLNWLPRVGVAYQINSKTVVRAGIGLFYENVIFNNVLFDRPLRLKTGAFNAVTSACLGGSPKPVPVASMLM